MIKRQLLRQSRAVSESLFASPPVRRSPFSSTPFASPRAAIPASFSSRIGRRWQSTDAEKKSPEESAPPAEEAKSEEAKEDPQKLELEKAKKEVVELKVFGASLVADLGELTLSVQDKYLRSVADYRNLQERTKREMESARQFALQRFATDLLDSIDNFDRALSSVPEAAVGKGAAAGTPAEPTPELNKDLVNLFSGLKMTEGILMSTLKKHGLERFDPMEGGGRKFDPNSDEATFFTKVEGKEDNDVFYTQSKGYKLNGRVVRAAKVGVVKNS